MKKELNAGDFVLIKTFEKRPKGWNHEGEMDDLMGKKAKVSRVCGNDIQIADPRDENERWDLKLGEFDLIEESVNEPEINVIL
jgi:hypothetical protein